MQKTELSSEAVSDAIHIQYNLIDLFNMGEVQMNNKMDSLFEWTDLRSPEERERMASKIPEILTCFFNLVQPVSVAVFGRELTWGIFNAATRGAMVKLKEGRK